MCALSLYVKSKPGHPNLDSLLTDAKTGQKSLVFKIKNGLELILKLLSIMIIILDYVLKTEFVWDFEFEDFLCKFKTISEF